MIICTVDGARPLDAPQTWDQQLDGACGVLPVLDAIDEQSGFNFMYSFWRPSAEELEALQDGGVIRLGIMGKLHPVINMGVVARAACDECGMTELPG